MGNEFDPIVTVIFDRLAQSEPSTEDEHQWVGRAFLTMRESVFHKFLARVQSPAEQQLLFQDIGRLIFDVFRRYGDLAEPIFASCSSSNGWRITKFLLNLPVCKKMEKNPAAELEASELRDFIFLVFRQLLEKFASNGSLLETWRIGAYAISILFLLSVLLALIMIIGGLRKHR